MKPGMIRDAVEREQEIVEGRFPVLRSNALSKLRVFVSALQLQEHKDTDSLIRQKAKDILFDALLEYTNSEQIKEDFDTKANDDFVEDMGPHFREKRRLTEKEPLRVIAEFFHLEVLWEVAFGGQKKADLNEAERKQILAWSKTLKGGE